MNIGTLIFAGLLFLGPGVEANSETQTETINSCGEFAKNFRSICEKNPKLFNRCHEFNEDRPKDKIFGVNELEICMNSYVEFGYCLEREQNKEIKFEDIMGCVVTQIKQSQLVQCEGYLKHFMNRHEMLVRSTCILAGCNDDEVEKCAKPLSPDSRGCEERLPDIIMFWNRLNRNHNALIDASVITRTQ